MPTTTSQRGGARGPRVGARAGLDVLLTDAVVGGGTRRFIQPRAVAAVGAGVARHPRSAARRASALGSELARVAAGRSQQAPVKGDRRFADPAWERNWLLRRVMQGYVAVGETVDGVISDAGLDWQTRDSRPMPSRGSASCRQTQEPLVALQTRIADAARRT